MKKIGILLSAILLLCGCGAETNEDILADFQNNITKSKSYKVEGSMEISNDEETFTYSLESYNYKDDYYKVMLVNQTNNHEQIILKNKEDIYVITPSLNKSFKFQSDWPDNSSQAYLLDSLAHDVKNDSKAKIDKVDDGYIIKTNVNYPNNEELKYQKIYLNSDKIPEKVEVFDENDIVKIKVIFNAVDLKAGLDEKDFILEDYIKETPEDTTNEENNTEENKKPDNNENSTNDKTPKEEDNKKSDSKEDNTTDKNKCEDGKTCENTNNEATENTATIDNIIYPLYIPSNTYLTSSEKVETSTGNRIILTFSGEKNFVLIEEKSVIKPEMEIVPVYGEPLMLSESIGALSANSLSWDVNSISYYLASTDLTVKEMKSVANSLGNSTLVAATK